MAISKVILNGDTLMDVTLDTVESNKILSGVRATAANGQDITGQIETKTSSNLTASGASVTAPAGYYSSSASKSVATTTHPNPTATINSSTGVVTASHTQVTGYVTGSTTTGTLNLSTQAAITITPTESIQTAVAVGKYTTGAVTVAAIDSEYVGSAVPRRTSSNLTASGATVTAPAGYYASSVSKAVASGSVTTPATTITAQPEISLAIETGLITATNTKTQSVTPTVSAGYVSSGTAGTITVSGGSTLQVATQPGKTVTPSKEEQTAVVAGKYTTGVVKVAPIPSNLLKAYTATITGSGDGYNYVQHNGNTYTSAGTFTFCKGDTISIKAYGDQTSNIYIDDELIEGSGLDAGILTYDFIAPGAPISISITVAGQGASGTVAITTTKLVITTNGTHATNDISEAIVDVHNSIVDMSWAKIKQCVNEGVDPSFLPIGTQINDKWTWQGTTYDAPWNVVHYNSQGMYLQWEYLTPEAIAFDAQEAMYYVGENGLAAGTYYITTSSSTGNSSWNSKNIQFTLTQACDPGDQFVISSPTGDPTASRTLTMYGYGSTTAKQTATTSSGTDGILLGTMGDMGATNENCNGVYCVGYGNHRWSQSAIRQWLNSDAAAGQWWQPQSPWDRPPTYAANKPGFLSGFSEEFKAVLETVPVVTALDTVSGFTEAYETTYDKIFLPTLWQMYSRYNSDLYDIEGESWDYWKQKAEEAGISGMMNNSIVTMFVKYQINNHNTSVSWLRSPYRTSNAVRCISGTGNISAGYYAYSTYQACPTCIVKKSTPTYIDRLSNVDWTTIKKMTGTDLEIGAQIIDQWTASNNGTVWDVPWDVVHYDDTAMYLRWHYNLPFAIPFDAQEAMYYVGENGLAAGTYYISTGSATGLSAWNDKNIQFTLASACDPGDQFVISNPTSDPTVSRTLTVYGFGETTAKQTTTTSSGTDGTLLGTMGNKCEINGNCNGVYLAVQGNHRWSQSNLRTWLNSDSPAGQWFTPMNPWDRPPDYASYPGFLYGFSSDFKDILAYSENKTLLDTVSGFTDTYEITQDKIFLPGLEQINYVPDTFDIEGEPWQYYQQLAEEEGIIGRFFGSNAVLKIFNLNATTTAGYSWLRSPYRSNYYGYVVTSTGGPGGSNVGGSYRAAPCCKINLVV